MHSPRARRLRARIAAGDMGGAADEALKALVDDQCYWSGGWEEVLRELGELPTERRRELTHAVAERYPLVGDHTESPWVR
jgi:hypothetical protein